MKSVLTILLFSLLSVRLFAQCEKVIINDSLFQIASQHNYNMLDQHNLTRGHPHSGKDTVFTLEKNILKFAVGYDSWQKSKKQLVTNGILQTGDDGKNFYELKLYFPQTSKDNGA